MSESQPTSSQRSGFQPGEDGFDGQHDSHGRGGPWVAPVVREYRPGREPGGLELSSDEAGSPVAALPDTGSIYSGSVWNDCDGSVVQVCDGTSCRLGGAKHAEMMVRRFGHECRKVYCLGFCDRSPVAMLPFEQISGHYRTPIRNVAPKAILTRRILEGGVPEIEKAMSVGVYGGLLAALQMPPKNLVEQVESSGERARNRGGFPTGKNWRIAAEADADQKYVVANGDEGDPGSFVDRILMEEDPHTIIEGMILCGYAVGASKGIAYIRSEYPAAAEVIDRAIREARKEGYLGENICGSGFSFDIKVFIGKGSYVCSEESALIASIEGLSGEVRLRPPYPTQVGLHGKPTVVNSVETLSKIPFIAKEGGAAYAFFGTRATSGTKAICLNHGFNNPGLVEVEFGITFREVIEKIGGGGRDGEPLAGILVGGPMGTILKPEDWDIPICFEVLDRHDIHLGHGGIVAIPESADFRDLLGHFVEFMMHESCAQCVPCRLGSQAFMKALEKNRDVSELEMMLNAIEEGCPSAFGKFVPGPIWTLLREFPDRVFGNGGNAGRQ